MSDSGLETTVDTITYDDAEDIQDMVLNHTQVVNVLDMKAMQDRIDEVNVEA